MRRRPGQGVTRRHVNAVCQFSRFGRCSQWSKKVTPVGWQRLASAKAGGYRPPARRGCQCMHRRDGTPHPGGWPSVCGPCMRQGRRPLVLLARKFVTEGRDLGPARSHVEPDRSSDAPLKNKQLPFLDAQRRHRWEVVKISCCNSRQDTDNRENAGFSRRRILRWLDRPDIFIQGAIANSAFPLASVPLAGGHRCQDELSCFLTERAILRPASGVPMFGGCFARLI